MGTGASTSHLHAVYLSCSATEPSESNQLSSQEDEIISEFTCFSGWAKQKHSMGVICWSHNSHLCSAESQTHLNMHVFELWEEIKKKTVTFL